jgi:hypothetical protein
VVTVSFSAEEDVHFIEVSIEKVQGAGLVINFGAEDIQG